MASIIVSLTLTVGLLVSVMVFVDYNVEVIVDEKISELEIDMYVYPDTYQSLDSINNIVKTMTYIDDSSNFITFKMDFIPEGSARNIFFALESTDKYNNTGRLVNGEEYFNISTYPDGIADFTPSEYTFDDIIINDDSVLVSYFTNEPTFISLTYESDVAVSLPDGGFGIHEGRVDSLGYFFNHSLIVGELVPDTDYIISGYFENLAHLRTEIVDEIFFTTLASASSDNNVPLYYDEEIEIVGNSSVKLSWKTDEKSMAIVSYGTDNVSLTEEMYDVDFFRFNHSVTLGPFDLNQTNYFKIFSWDAFGNIQNALEMSDTFSITTDLLDNTAPEIIFTGWFTRYPTILITWITSEPAYGNLSFGYFLDDISYYNIKDDSDSEDYLIRHAIGVMSYSSYETEEMGGIDIEAIERYNNTEYLKDGMFSFEENGTIISDNLASKYNLTIGDTFELSWIVYKQTGYSVFPKSLYFPFKVSAIAHTHNRTLGGDRIEEERGVELYPLFDILRNDPKEILMNYDYADYILETIASYAGGEDYVPGGVPRSDVLGNRFVYVWVDRENVIRSDNLEWSIFLLKSLRRQIELQTDPLIAFSPIEQTLIKVQAQVFFDRFFFLVFSVPTIGLTWYVTQYAANVTLIDRKEDIGLLKTKGVSFGQVASITGTEVGFIAIVGTSLGILVGTVNGWLMQSIVEFFSFDLSQIDTIQPFITPFTLLYSLIYAFIITIVGIGIPSLLLSRNFVVKILKAESEETGKLSRVFQKVRIDIILFVVGVGMMVLILSQGGLIAMVNPILEWLVLISPLILALGSIGMIGRSLPYFASPIVRLSKPFIGELNSLIKKQLTRRVNRSSSIMGVVLITVMLGVYTSISAHSIAEARVSEEHYSLGADLVVEPSLSRTLSSLNLTKMKEEIIAMDGIEEVSIVYYGRARLGGINDVPVMYVDPDSFKESAYTRNYFVKSNNINKSISKLDNNSIIISQGIIDEYGINLGDTFNASLMFGGIGGQGLPLRPVYLEVTDVSTHWPTFSPKTIASGAVLVYYYNQFVVNNNFLIMSSEFVDQAREDLGSNPLEDMNFFVKLDGTVAAAEIAYNIEVEYGNTVSITTAEENMATARESLEVRSYFSILTINLIFALIVTVFAISSFIAHIIKQRRYEFGVLKAIGLTNNGVASLIALETASLAIIGIILGFVIGYLTSFQLLKMIDFSFALPIHQVVSLYDFILIFILTVSAVIIGTWIPIRKIFKMEVMEVMAVD